MLAAIAAAAAMSAVTISSDQRHDSVSSRIASGSAAQGAVVVRDPDTGQLREPTADELVLLQGDQVQATEAPQPISASGFDGLQLDDSQMVHTVATRNADGTVSIQHASGRRDAERQVRAAGRGLVAGKEQALER